MTKNLTNESHLDFSLPFRDGENHKAPFLWIWSPPNVVSGTNTAANDKAFDTLILWAETEPDQLSDLKCNLKCSARWQSSPAAQENVASWDSWRVYAEDAGDNAISVAPRSSLLFRYLGRCDDLSFPNVSPSFGSRHIVTLEGFHSISMIRCQ